MPVPSGLARLMRLPGGKPGRWRAGPATFVARPLRNLLPIVRSELSKTKPNVQGVADGFPSNPARQAAGYLPSLNGIVLRQRGRMAAIAGLAFAP